MDSLNASKRERDDADANVDNSKPSDVADDRLTKKVAVSDAAERYAGPWAAEKDLIKEGDYVILYFGVSDGLTPYKVARGATCQTKYGMFNLEDLIGHSYGRKFFSFKGQQGWGYALRTTSELLARGALTQRTQLVHSSDASFIVGQLEVRGGFTVVEAGTGSGSLTFNFARAVGAAGHVYTFEFHEQRAQQARELFQTLQCSQTVTVTHRDVCAGGFVLESGELKASTADAVFLDLPSPWLAVDHAVAILKVGGMVCCYSPCVEQVARTCNRLRELGVHELRTVEVRQQPWEGSFVAESWWNYDATNTDTERHKIESVRNAFSYKIDASKQQKEEHRVLLKPKPGEVPGHTAFLTFARKVKN